MNEKSSQFAREEDQRKGTSCPHFSPPGCSLTIKVNWLHLHSELSEPSHLLGLQFHPVPAALIKSHTLFFFFPPLPNFTLPPTVFFSALLAWPPPPPPCPHSIYTPPPDPTPFRRPEWVCKLPAKASVTWGEDSASAYWHGVSHHPGSAQLPGRCCCGPCVSSSCIGTAWTWLPGRKGQRRQLPVCWDSSKEEQKKKKKRRIYSDENNVTFAPKSCSFFSYSYSSGATFPLSVATHVHFIHYEKKPFAQPLKGKEARVGI